jgi:aspartate racemase
MNIVGMIGGIGPESTIEYYRLLITGYRARVADGSYPAIVINSINLETVRTLVEANELPRLTKHLLEEIHRLAKAGAECGFMAANTPHIVFDSLRRQSPIPLISIVEATCEAAQAQGLKRLALFGTRFTMQGHFFPQVFSQAGIALVVPQPDEQTYIHDKYMDELVPGTFLPETRAGLLGIAQRMQQRDHIDGLILGGTELPLILGNVNGPVPFLDTTRIHVQAVLAHLLG